MFFNVDSTGSGGYFNLQKDPTAGIIWALHVTMYHNDTIYFHNTQGLSFNVPYARGVWFELKLAIDFDTNNWEVFIDGVSPLNPPYFASIIQHATISCIVAQEASFCLSRMPL